MTLTPLCVQQTTPCLGTTAHDSSINFVTFPKGGSAAPQVQVCDSAPPPPPSPRCPRLSSATTACCSLLPGPLPRPLPLPSASALCLHPLPAPSACALLSVPIQRLSSKHTPNTEVLFLSDTTVVAAGHEMNPMLYSKDDAGVW